ncbi:lactonase family protein [Mucilaginibacter myungsuensis]|uniref:Lactonase family protein n=1 Tax=Mucilaginibacter myungsuensis TaxID=649104 RepID=A0A929KT07_9SPHI|nr:lactonase family protein [Mucilaginibacter myungsuensis]MBE9660999.1 lactonase family protein [Mucilaginibacter myungsuensis]MDN3597143.1 lactonase family protein [Mucilaginibacter myungsuensis]
MKKALIAATLLLSANAFAQKKDMTPKMYDLLIGTYTSGESQGIYVYRFYTETGKTAYLNVAEGVDNPSYLAIGKNNKFVYSVNEVGDDRKGSVSAFSFEPYSGKIALINKQPTTGAGPCYIAVDKANKHAFVANYAGGSLSVLPIGKAGSLGAVTQTVQDQGSSVNNDRQAGPHVHTAMLSPDEKYLLYTDLGTDKINIMKHKSGQDQPLTPAEPAALEVKPGDGPRHLDFTPDKKFMYLLTEMTGTIYAYSYDGPKSKQLETVSIVPEGFKGKVGAADIHVSPDGKFLYASNRGDVNEIVVFSIAPETGKLTFVERKSTLGKTPRNFVIDPSGNFLLVANQDSNNIYVFRINKQTGKLNVTPHILTVPNPVCLKFTPAE